MLASSHLTENSWEKQGCCLQHLDRDAGERPPRTVLGHTSGRIAATSGKNREEADPMGREQVHPDPAGEARNSPAPRGIVVGVDGSDHSQCALVWAAREAERRQRPLHIVTAYSVPIFAASGLDGGYATVDDSVIREGAEAILKQAMDKVAGYNIDVDASVENGDASGVLLDMSETAELLVFGTRGRGGFVGRLLGSVSSALPAHAKCPTVTIPLICADRLGETTDDRHVLAERAKSGHVPVENVVVVGVDGSDQARVAVLEAAAQAERFSAPLRLVCAVPQYNGSLAWVPAPMDRDALFADIKVQLDAGVAWLKSHFPRLTVETQLVDGSPVDILVDASRHVELVVVGTRGRGGFTGMLLGSTSDGILHHAKGPVMVVPDRDDPRLADRAAFGPLLGD
jgi:nucleotide-binding universal stress UspA family protein